MPDENNSEIVEREIEPGVWAHVLKDDKSFYVDPRYNDHLPRD